MRRTRTKPARNTRLAFLALEDRCTPATAIYAAATQTLTIAAAQSDHIEVASIPTLPDGFIQVSDGSPVFDSSVLSQPVSNLTVHFEGVNNGALSLHARMHLDGNLNVLGARQSQTLESSAEFGGSVAYRASASATDTVTFSQETRVDGNLTLSLRAGGNTVSLRGGAVGGNLTMTAGGGDDRVELIENDDLRLGGSATFKLGNGLNEIVGIGAHEFEVGKSLTFVGGSGADHFDMSNAQTSLLVDGNLIATLRAAGDYLSGAQNQVYLNVANIGGNLYFAGGSDSDDFQLHNDLILGGNLRLSLRTGENITTLVAGAGLDYQIAGNFYYTGGSGMNVITIRSMTVQKNMHMKFGNGGALDEVHVEFGHADFPATVHGALKISGSPGNDNFLFRSTHVGGEMHFVTGAGHDRIDFDDVTIDGNVMVNFGAGNDLMLVEWYPFDTTGTPLDDVSFFGGNFSVLAGDGDDEVSLSDDSDATTSAHFGGNVQLIGGAGSDTFQNDGNIFALTGNLEDFELGDTLP
jgi:hypothetical protein